MATRFIKDSIWTSPNLNSLSDQAERHFYRLLPLPDDHGCCELTAAVVKGRCYPLKPKVTPELIQKWNAELEAADIIRTWVVKGRVFAWFPTWSEHQRIRSLNKRKTPEPPSSVVNCRQVTTEGADCGSLPSLLSSLSSPSFMSGKEPDVDQRDWKKEAQEILIFLNSKAKRNYEPVKANLDLIVNRLKDGATVQDCKSIIAKKCREWSTDEKMCLYLRPATLFNASKFAQYKGELLKVEVGHAMP